MIKLKIKLMLKSNWSMVNMHPSSQALGNLNKLVEQHSAIALCNCYASCTRRTRTKPYNLVVKINFN